MMKKYALEIFLVVVVATTVSLPGYALLDSSEDVGHGSDPLAAIGIIYLVLITRPFKYGAFFAFLNAVRDRQMKVKDMFDVLQNYLNAVLANLFVLVIIAIGTVFFVVPGIIFACRLSFTSFLVVERKMEAVEAVKESWRLTRGYSWTVFLIALLSIPIGILGLALFGVGVIAAMMWVGMAHASLYYAVTSPGAAGTGEYANAS
jgi:uncharacterized membrane protein